MHALRTGMCLILLAALVSACGADETPGEAATSDGEAENGEAASEYRVVLGNAITDTLRGNASFGIVYEPQSGDKHFVIRLASNYDFAGGFVLAHRDTTRPEAGSYSLSVESDSPSGAAENEFFMLYREGMLRDMRASSGSLQLTTVTDSLVEGTFDASLRGRVAGLDRESAASAEVHAVGRFRAERDLDGFIIGL